MWLKEPQIFQTRKLMKTTTRNFWIDLVLLVFYSLTIALLFTGGRGATVAERSGMQHAHAFSGIVLIIFSFIHIWQHRQWIWAAATGKLRGKRVKLLMYCLAAVLMVLAFFTGDAGMHADHVPGSHTLVGYTLLVGLLVHIVKHAQWMIATARRLVIPDRSRGSVRVPLSTGIRAGRSMEAASRKSDGETRYRESVSG
jgi:hypothetical protein